jgi:hypothetical protein
MRRIVAAPLWFLVGWYVGSVAAWALGLGAFVAPIVAVALAGLVVWDPRRMIWGRPSTGEPLPGEPTRATADAEGV